MIRAAGILILSTKGNALFLKRSSVGDAAGMWCIPGGKLEAGEDSIEAALRETREEIGYKTPKSKLVKWTRRVTTASETTARETVGAVAAVTSQGPPADAATVPAVPLSVALANAATPEAIPASGEEVDFTTYLLTNVEEFIPTLNEEHVAFAWAPISQPPEPLHPGVRTALNRFTMNELGVAEAMRDGQLTSPQKYENIWLFDIRITGTGVAFRHEHKDAKGKVTQESEYAIRDPNHYLTPEFLARCNGLPVILQHPKDKSMMDGSDFKERAIGTVFLPYIRETVKEVWAIAKVYDDPAAEMMQTIQLSTSPAVVWREDNDKLKLEDGQNVLIEGKPSLLDHIAVCWQGVWDKGGDPTGVSIVRGDETMATKINLKRLEGETDAGYQARCDEAAALINPPTPAVQAATATPDMTAILNTLNGFGDAIKGVATRLDEVQRRFDADDKEKETARKDAARGRADTFKFGERQDDEDDDKFKKRMDAEEEKLRADMEEAGEDKEKAAKDSKGRRDAFEKEEESKRADKGRKDTDDEKEKDKARADSIDDLREQIRTLSQRVTTPVSDADLNAIGKVQARADAVYSALGSRARAILPGESLLSYRRHFVNELKEHSDRWKGKDLTLVAASDELFTTIEEQVLDDALKSARSPANVKPGTLRMDEQPSGNGHIIRSYHGSPSVWMGPLAGPVRQAVTVFNLPTARQ